MTKITPLFYFTIFFLTVLFVNLQNTHAEDLKPEIKEYGLIDPPKCITSEGTEIKIYPGTSEQIVQFGGFLAVAGDFEVGKDGGIVNEDRIYYDEANMPFLHPLLQEFLFHHECAHVTLSHLEIPLQKRQGLYWDIEQSADCQAFIDIKEDSHNFSTDSDVIMKNFAFIADIMMKNAPGNPELRKKFIAQRMDKMRACPVFQN